MKNRSRLKILKISCIYGGVLSLILVGLYAFLVVAFPGTMKFMPIQVTLLLTGLVSATIFSYMHLNYARENPEEFSFPILPGIIITAICLASGMIFIIPQLLGVFYGNLESVVYMTILSTPGYISLILGILSAYAVLSGSRRSPGSCSVEDTGAATEHGDPRDRYRCFRHIHIIRNSWRCHDAV